MTTKFNTCLGKRVGASNTGAPRAGLAAGSGARLEVALFYVRQGWSVFPCHSIREGLCSCSKPDCESPGKHPYTLSGFKEATTDGNQIRRWWASWPAANLAVATGAVSGFFVLDIDGEEGIQALAELEQRHGPLPDTVVVKTPRPGLHLYFRHPSTKVGCAGLAPHVDTRGDGGYVILPPSSHVRGGYKWAGGNGIPNTSEIAEPPTWLLELIQPKPTPVATAPLRPCQGETKYGIKARVGELAEVRAKREPGRYLTLNNAALKLGHLVASGHLDEATTAQGLTDAGLSTGLSQKEVDRGVRLGLRDGKQTPKGPEPRPARRPLAVVPTQGKEHSTPANSEVDIGSLLNETERFIDRFIAFRSDHAPVALALYCAHCHAFDAARYTPYPVVSSPEPLSGKSRVLEVVAMLVPRPWMVLEPSEAVIYRKITVDRPTLLLDEFDSIFRKRENEGIRAMLNAGFRRGSTVPRCVGEGTKQTVKDFSVWCPKILAGIGRTSDAVETRSIPIRLQRRRANEPVDDFDEELEEPAASGIRQQLEMWAAANVAKLKGQRPPTPAGLTDRQRDIWRPLLAIADAVGGDWPTRAREAAMELHKKAEPDDSNGILLLAHIRDAFTTAKADRLTSDELLRALVEREEAPWPDWWGSDVRAGNIRGPGSRVARLLKGYGPRPQVIRFGDTTHRGYERAWFEDVWERYLPQKEESE